MQGAQLQSSALLLFYLDNDHCFSLFSKIPLISCVWASSGQCLPCLVLKMPHETAGEPCQSQSAPQHQVQHCASENRLNRHEVLLGNQCWLLPLFPGEDLQCSHLFISLFFWKQFSAYRPHAFHWPFACAGRPSCRRSEMGGRCQHELGSVISLTCCSYWLKDIECRKENFPFQISHSSYTKNLAKSNNFCHKTPGEDTSELLNSDKWRCEGNLKMICSQFGLWTEFSSGAFPQDKQHQMEPRNLLLCCYSSVLWAA